jgi:polar amino acid transport system substrate-binding protein
MRLFVKAALAAAGVFAMAALGATGSKADKLAEIVSKGVVRIGVPLDAPPFGSQDANRKPVGFDIELAEMVGKALA